MTHGSRSFCRGAPSDGATCLTISELGLESYHACNLEPLNLYKWVLKVEVVGLRRWNVFFWSDFKKCCLIPRAVTTAIRETVPNFSISHCAAPRAVPNNSSLAQSGQTNPKQFDSSTAPFFKEACPVLLAGFRCILRCVVLCLSDRCGRPSHRWIAEILEVQA